MMLRPLGLAWFGVPCSTFVWMAFGHTGRSHRFPEGNNDRIDVSCANRIIKRVLVICAILTLRAVWFVIEQPHSSVLFLMKCWKEFEESKPKVRGFACQRHFLWMGALGHVLPKPTVLHGCFPGFGKMKTKRPSSKMVKHNRAKVGTIAWQAWVNSASRRRWAGKAKMLKKSGEYTRRFADLAICAAGLRRSK